MPRCQSRSTIITILINTDPNWHQQTNPLHTKYPDTHVIIYIPPNTLQYTDPIKPTYDDDSSIEPHAIQILCIHHKPTIIGNLASLQQISTYVINLDILIQVTLPTPPNTKVHHHKLWHILPNSPSWTSATTIAHPFPNYTFVLPPKYLPEYSYYIDGSFFPPQ